MTRYVFRIYAIVDDGKRIEAGTLELTSPNYGELTEQEAAAAARSEMTVDRTNGVVQWRGFVIPLDRFLGFSAELVSMWVE